MGRKPSLRNKLHHTMRPTSPTFLSGFATVLAVLFPRTQALPALSVPGHDVLSALLDHAAPALAKAVAGGSAEEILHRSGEPSDGPHIGNVPLKYALPVVVISVLLVALCVLIVCLRRMQRRKDPGGDLAADLISKDGNATDHQGGAFRIPSIKHGPLIEMQAVSWETRVVRFLHHRTTHHLFLVLLALDVLLVVVSIALEIEYLHSRERGAAKMVDVCLESISNHSSSASRKIL